MQFLGVLLLAVSLSMDALGIGVSYGLRGIRTPWPAKIVLCITSMLVMSAAVALGSGILLFLSEEAARWIGAGMLVLLGIFIVIQGLSSKGKKERPRKEKRETVWNIALKSFGVTIKIIRNPASCDFDGSSHIDVFEAVYLGAALSVDSFGAGVSSAVSGMHSAAVPLTAGAVQLLFLCAGLFLGRRLKRLAKADSRVFVVLSGVLLIVLALLRLLCA